MLQQDFYIIENSCWPIKITTSLYCYSFPTAQSVSTDSATAIPTIASSSSENPDEEGEPIFVCSLCLLPCHLSCSIQAFANIDRFVPSGLMMKFPTIKPESVPGRLSGLAGHSGVESSLQTLCAFCKGSIQWRTSSLSLESLDHWFYLNKKLVS